MQIIHERQERRFCAEHALRNVLQNGDVTPAVFRQAFDTITKRLETIITGEDRINTSEHGVKASGDWDIHVLQEAADIKGYNCYISPTLLLDEDIIEMFIKVFKRQFKGLVLLFQEGLWPGHYTSLRMHETNEKCTYHDSLHLEPKTATIHTAITQIINQKPRCALFVFKFHQTINHLIKTGNLETFIRRTLLRHIGVKQPTKLPKPLEEWLCKTICGKEEFWKHFLKWNNITCFNDKNNQENKEIFSSLCAWPEHAFQVYSLTSNETLTKLFVTYKDEISRSGSEKKNNNIFLTRIESCLE